MPYDFSTLSPPEFEELTHDLLERKYSIELQSFTSGRDRGIDLRHASTPDMKVIVQCKHYVKSSYSALLSNLKNKELPKLRKLSPARYILSTSVGLTPANVDELLRILHPFCRSPHDIIGQSDLNDLLRKHRDLEQRHFKLWMTSEPVLTRLLNNSVFIQSALTIDEIKRRLSLFVYTDSVAKASEQLERDHVCIIAGIPGIGKTTLAEMLLVEYIFNDWQIVTITHHINDALDVYQQDPEASQVFYYDDFLGQVSSADKLGKNEDKSILRFIAAVERNPRKRFLLTTREYILAQAKATHEPLQRSDIDIFKYVLECEEYTEVDKARILLNHLFFWDVPQEHIAEIVSGRQYRKIIDHENYSPRLIEWMTKPKSVSGCPPQEYADKFIRQLDDPWELWQHAFQYQIGESARSLLISLTTCNPAAFSNDLCTCFEAIHAARASRKNFPTREEDFNESMNELEGNFLRLERVHDDVVVSFHNPSVLDFMRRVFHDSRTLLEDTLSECVYFDQVRCLTDLDREREREYPSCSIEIMIAALERTMDSKAITLEKRWYQSGRTRWLRHGMSRWGRLEHCVRLLAQWNDRSLREFVAFWATKWLEKASYVEDPIWAVTGAIDALIKEGGFGTKQLDDWMSRCTRFVEAALEDELDDPVNDLLAAAKWYCSHEDGLDTRGEELRQTLVSKVEVLASESTDVEEAEWILGELDSFEAYLGEDFKSEKEDLSQWLSDQEREGDYGYDDHGYSRGAGGNSESIDGMFDSLLE